MINGNNSQFICSRTIGFSAAINGAVEFNFDSFVEWIRSHRDEVTYGKVS